MRSLTNQIGKEVECSWIFLSFALS